MTRLFAACAILFFGSIAMNLIWESVVVGYIYHCTDDTALGFFSPGDWVHGSVAYVDSIDIHRSMSEPDMMLNGWSEGKLWAMWIGMAFVVLVFSIGIPLRVLRQAPNRRASVSPA